MFLKKISNLYKIRIIHEWKKFNNIKINYSFGEFKKDDEDNRDKNPSGFGRFQKKKKQLKQKEKSMNNQDQDEDTLYKNFSKNLNINKQKIINEENLKNEKKIEDSESNIDRFLNEKFNKIVENFEQKGSEKEKNTTGFEKFIRKNKLKTDIDSLKKIKLDVKEEEEKIKKQFEEQKIENEPNRQNNDEEEIKKSNSRFFKPKNKMTPPIVKKSKEKPKNNSKINDIYEKLSFKNNRNETKDEENKSKQEKNKKPDSEEEGPNFWTTLEKFLILLTDNYLIIIPSFLICFLSVHYYEKYQENNNTISIQVFFDEYLSTHKVHSVELAVVKGGSYTQNKAKINIIGETSKIIPITNIHNFIEMIESYNNDIKAFERPPIHINFSYSSESFLKYERSYDFILAALSLYLLLNFVKAVRKTVSNRMSGSNDIFGISRSNAKTFIVDTNVKVKFKDVAGLNEAKLEISEFVDFLKRPRKYKDLGARLPKGALMSGPPGTGKTMLAKACAGEAGVPFFYISGSDFVEMFVGVGAARVRDLFQQAKEKAPAMIFIDEIDAVGRKRDSQVGGNDERDNTLNQLLVEMDGFGTDSQVVVIAATNRKELLDSALTRPGRFDRTIEITLPDLDGRFQIFKVHLAPIKLNPEKTMEEYAKRLSTLTPGFSGADIANLCNEAALIAARNKKNYVDSMDFELASERVIAGLEKKKMLSEEERRTVAFHEAGHAVASWFIEGGTPLLKITIIPRSKGSLGFAQYLPNESSMETKEELLDRICCILGGRISEEICFKKVTTGAYDDLEKAFKIANAIVTKFGMSNEIGFVGLPDGNYYKRISNKTQDIVDSEIKKIINSCADRCRATLLKYKNELDKLANKLLEKDTIDLNGIIEILGDRPFPPKSNFKAYLESKKSIQKEEEEKNKEKKEEIIKPETIENLRAIKS